MYSFTYVATAGTFPWKFSYKLPTYKVFIYKNYEGKARKIKFFYYNCCFI